MESFRSTLRNLRRSPLLYAFAGVWLTCALVLVLKGHAGLLTGSVGVLALTALVGGSTLALTPAPPEEPLASPRWMLWLQVAVVLLIIFLTGWTALSFHKVAPAEIPLWSALEGWLLRVGEVAPNPLWLHNPVRYVLIPGALLFLMGARLPEMGFRRGVRSWRVLIPWGILLLASVAVRMAMGGGVAVLTRLPLRFADHFFSNGFMEEFLFRGALMSRLNGLLGSGWSLLLSSWLFGAWHLGMTTAAVQGDFVMGFALAILNQGTTGLLFGLVAQRTRSLLAPSAAHILQNSL